MMKKTLYRWIAAAACLALMATLFAGCGSKDKGQPAAASQQSEEEDAQKDDQPEGEKIDQAEDESAEDNTAEDNTAENNTPGAETSVDETADLAIGENAVQIAYLTDLNTEETDYEIFAADEGDYAVPVVFACDKPVRNLRLFALELDEIDDDGNASFFYKTVYEQPMLVPEEPFAAAMNMPEILPLYGFSYEDGEGIMFCYGIEMSGMDGSLLTSPIWEMKEK